MTAASLVVGTAGTFIATTMTSTAFAYKEEDDGNGNTITPQTNNEYGIVSGFDNSFDQELRNVICTHPSASCSDADATTTGGAQQELVCLSGQIAITGLPFTSSAVCVFQNLLFASPCNDKQTGVMFLNSSRTCLDFLIIPTNS